MSIYVRQSSTGKGIGSKLLQALIETSEANGFWTLQAQFFPSLQLHKKWGFREIGRRERIGKMNGV